MRFILGFSIFVFPISQEGLSLQKYPVPSQFLNPLHITFRVIVILIPPKFFLKRTKNNRKFIVILSKKSPLYENLNDGSHDLRMTSPKTRNTQSHKKDIGTVDRK